MKGERREIQKRLQGHPEGTCAIISDPAGKLRKFRLFVVNSNRQVQEVPLQLKGGVVHAEIDGDDAAFTTIQGLAGNVCTPDMQLVSLVSREALTASVKDKFEAFCRGKEVYQNEVSAKKVIQDIQDKFPACARIATSAIYQNEAGDYRVLMWDSKNKQFSKVALDFSTSPGSILFHLDNPKNPVVLKRCPASEIDNFFLRECGRDV